MILYQEEEQMGGGLAAEVDWSTLPCVIGLVCFLLGSEAGIFSDQHKIVQKRVNHLVE